MNNGASTRRAIRGRVLSYRDDPVVAGEDKAIEYCEDGIVVIEDGLIVARGEAAEIAPTLADDVPIDDYPECFILPGFIDTHIHYPQAGIIASYGAQLMDWLETYTFPEEARFVSGEYAADSASWFMDELARNGTTTAVAYCTVHGGSTDAFFTEAQKRGARMIGGKVLMERNAPESLLEDADTGDAETRRLIDAWHGKDRLSYAVTPRFAITSTEVQLDMCGVLLKDYPDVYMQTHLSENRDEIAAVKDLFPDATSYTDVYDRAGLLGPRSIFGHGIYLDDAELGRLSETESVIAFCPSSNLFIGSGLFDLDKTVDQDVRVSLATDVGAGTSYSMLRTAHDAYKVLHLQGQTLGAHRALYMMTLGNARALKLEDRIGTLAPGSEADIVVLDPKATPVLRHRTGTAEGLGGTLFALVILGDEACVRATYIAGELATPSSE